MRLAQSKNRTVDLLLTRARTEQQRRYEGVLEDFLHSGRKYIRVEKNEECVLKSVLRADLPMLMMIYYTLYSVKALSQISVEFSQNPHTVFSIFIVVRYECKHHDKKLRKRERVRKLPYSVCDYFSAGALRGLKIGLKVSLKEFATTVHTYSCVHCPTCLRNNSFTFHIGVGIVDM